MYFSSHSSDKQYFSSQKIDDENVVFLATTHDKSGLTRWELPCVVTRNETLFGYRNCINFRDILIFSRSWYSWSHLSWWWEMVKPANLSGTPGDQGLHDLPYFPKILMHLKFHKRVEAVLFVWLFCGQIDSTENVLISLSIINSIPIIIPTLKIALHRCYNL